MNRKIGVILSYVLMIFEVLSTLLLTPFILRTLGRSEYGVYNLSLAVTSYILLLDLGVGNAVIKYVAQFRVSGEKEQERRFMGIATIYYALIALISLIIGIVLVIIFPSVFAEGLSVDEIVLGQKLLVVTITNAAVTLGTAAYANIIIAYEKFVIARGWSICQIILRVILTLVALKCGMGSVGIVLVNLTMTICCRCLFIIYVRYWLKLKPLFSGVKLSFIKEIVAYSSFILLQMIATQINVSAGQVLLGVLVPSATILIGVYGIGTQIIQYFQSIGSAMSGVLMPGIVQFVSNNPTKESVCDEMVRIGRLILIVLVCIFICFVVFGEQFISLWAGSENIEAFKVAVVLMFAYMFILTESVGNQILWAKNLHREQSILKLSIVIVNIIISILLIKWKPLMGIIVATFISLMIGDVLVLNLIYKKKLEISLLKYYKGLFKGIFPCAVVAIICGYLFRLLNLTGWVGFFINVIIMVGVYIICMILFGFNNYEKNLITRIMKGVIKQ